MAKDPAMLWYPSDWISGTQGMSFEEKGAYIELLMMQFNRGHLTTDMVGRVVGQVWGQINHKFMQDKEGLWYNERLDLEKNKRKSFTDSRKNNLEGKNQYSKRGHTSNRMENVNENINKNAIRFSEDFDFAIFIDGSQIELGKEQKLLAKTNKIKPRDVIKGLPIY